MPVLDLPKTLAEVGRIRIGRTVPVMKDGVAVIRDGKPVTRPDKLGKFRLTSPDKKLLENAAAIYGGKVNPWDGHVGQFELFTEKNEIPVFISPSDASQWLELWSGGGCVRRCDGQTCILYKMVQVQQGTKMVDKETQTAVPCMCSKIPKQRECKLTTRASFILRELPNIGSWRLESHGFGAAIELPASIDLLRQVGGMIRASLCLEFVSKMSYGKKKEYYVPRIKLDLPMAFQDAIEGGLGAKALGQGSAQSQLPRSAGGSVVHTDDHVYEPEIVDEEVHKEKLASEVKAEGGALL